MSINSGDRLKWIKILALFFGGIALALGLGYYQHFTKYDQISYAITFEGQSKNYNTVDLDLAKLALPKKLLQPDNMRVLFTLKNAGNNNLNVIVQTEGFEGKSIVKISKNIVVLPNGTNALELKPNQPLHGNPKLEIHIDSKNEKYVISEGVIRFSNEAGAILAQVPVRVINSQYKHPGVAFNVTQ